MPAVIGKEDTDRSKQEPERRAATIDGLTDHAKLAVRRSISPRSSRQSDHVP